MSSEVSAELFQIMCDGLFWGLHPQSVELGSANNIYITCDKEMRNWNAKFFPLFDVNFCI